MTENEEKIYEIAGGEVASKNVKPGVWSKAYSSALGDEAKTKAIYIQLRVDQLRAQVAAGRQQGDRHVSGNEQEQLDTIRRKFEPLRGIPFEDTDYILSEQFIGEQSSLKSPISVSRTAGIVGLLEFQIIDLIKRGYLHGILQNNEWYFDLNWTNIHSEISLIGVPVVTGNTGEGFAVCEKQNLPSGRTKVSPVKSMQSTHLSFPTLMLALFLLGGCDSHPPIVKQPSAKDRILSDTNEIVSNPNAWNTNSRYFADFVRASVELHWEDMPEIKDLKANVADLNVFATQWVQELNSVQLKTFSISLQNIAADVQAGNNTKIVPPAVSAKIRSDTTQQQLAELFANTTGQLTKEQAEKYAGLYKKLIDSYERFYKFAINNNL